MTEPTGTGGIVDTETALQREVELLAQRFPDVDPGTLDSYVRDTFTELKDHAAVTSHLVAVTHGQVTKRLIAEGAELHVPGSETGSETGTDRERPA